MVSAKDALIASMHLRCCLRGVDGQVVDQPLVDAGQRAGDLVALPEQGLLARLSRAGHQDHPGYRGVLCCEPDGEERGLAVAEHEDAMRIDDVTLGTQPPQGGGGQPVIEAGVPVVALAGTDAVLAVAQGRNAALADGAGQLEGRR